MNYDPHEKKEDFRKIYNISPSASTVLYIIGEKTLP